MYACSGGTSLGYVHLLPEQLNLEAARMLTGRFATVRSHSGKGGFGTIIPIPGSSTEARAIENNKEVTLTHAELSELDEIMKKTEVVGGRGG